MNLATGDGRPTGPMTLTTLAVLFALSQKAQVPKPQKIVFDEDELIVERKSPDLEHIYVRAPTKFQNLIKIRENFADKIVKSVDQM